MDSGWLINYDYWCTINYHLHWNVHLQPCHITNTYTDGLHRWLSARLQYLQCVSNGDTAVLHQAIDKLGHATPAMQWLRSHVISSKLWYPLHQHSGDTIFHQEAITSALICKLTCLGQVHYLKILSKILNLFTKTYNWALLKVSYCAIWPSQSPL